MDTVWLIVGASMFIVLGSVFWILPSQADRQRMALRQIAYQHGFQVRAMKPEEIMKKFAINTKDGLLHYYSKQGLFKWYYKDYERFSNLVIIPEKAAWRLYSAPDPDRPLTNVKSVIPLEYQDNSVNCFYLSGKEVGMLWNERADTKTTERLLSMLESLFSSAEQAKSTQH